MQPKVLVIILDWNSHSDTLECLESLKNNDYPNMRIVVVDNGSKEKFHTSDTDIKVIYNEKNLGFSSGNNIGIKYALENGADYVLLLNNDTITSREFLSRMVKTAESDKKNGLVGSKIYFWPAKNKLWYAGGKINWLYNKGTMRGYGEQDGGQYDIEQETEYVTGCCLLIKREVIEKIGLMPEEYFLYYEDVDWSLKARKAGYKCVFTPFARIWHKGSSSSQEASPGYIYYHVRNGLILAEKFAPWYIKPFVHINARWRLKKQIIKWLFVPSKRNWAKYILLGIKDFYFNKTGKNENWY